MLRQLLRHFSTYARRCYLSFPNVSYMRRSAFGAATALALYGKTMLKVTIVNTRNQRRLILEGALVQPWVEELKRTWAAAVDESPARRLVVDLNNVTTISKEGEGVLSDFMRQGARFLCAAVFTKYQLKKITRKFQPKLSSVKNHGSSND